MSDTAPMSDGEPKNAKPQSGKKKRERRARGEGSIHYSQSKGCWVWRAVVGYKPDGSVRYTEGRTRTEATALKAKRAAEKSGRLPSGERMTVGEYLDYWLNDVIQPNVRPATWGGYEPVFGIISDLRVRVTIS